MSARAGSMSSLPAAALITSRFLLVKDRFGWIVLKKSIGGLRLALPRKNDS
jgi:hypothetical protein